MAETLVMPLASYAMHRTPQPEQLRIAWNILGKEAELSIHGRFPNFFKWKIPTIVRLPTLLELTGKLLKHVGKNEPKDLERCRKRWSKV